jgi:hypothetical protein
MRIDMVDVSREKHVTLGEVVVKTAAEALPEWAFEPGTIIGLSVNGVGDFGIVRAGAEDGCVALSSIGNRVKRQHRREAIEGLRPVVLIPAITARGLRQPLEGGWYQTSSGLVVVRERRHWWDPLRGVGVKLPLVPELVVRWEPERAEKEDEE